MKERYLMIIEKVEDSYRIEPVLNFKKIKFERTRPTQYNIWATERQVIDLNETFDYVSVIKIG